MVNVENVREALGYLEDTVVGNWVRGETAVITDKKVDYAEDKVRYTNDFFKYVSGFEELKTSLFIKVEHNIVKDLKFALVFKVNGYKTQKCYLSVPQRGMDAVAVWLSQVFQDFIDSETYIDMLNRAVKRSKEDSLSGIDVEYSADYTRRDSCRVADWNYKKINLGIGMYIVLKMRELSEVQWENLQHSNYYNGSIKDLIVGFNNFELHRKIGATLIGNVRQILSSSKLNMNDAIRKIMKNNRRMGVQNLTTCTYISELGEYMILCNWKVDYGNRKIDISIIDNMILDLSNNRFICRGEVYAQLERRVQLPEQRSPIIFGDMTVEEFINQ